MAQFQKIINWMFIFLISINLHATNIIQDQAFEVDTRPNPFFLITIPKSGTHLIVKLLQMLTNYDLQPFKEFDKSYEEIETALINGQKNEQIFCYHPVPGNFHIRIKTFSQLHPDYLPILQIRDLRDMMISTIYFFEGFFINNEFHEFDERLNYLLDLDNQEKVDFKHYILNTIQEAIKWLENPNTVVIKFEHIIGFLGRGCIYIQLKTILSLATALNISLSNDKLNKISQDLFGIQNGPKITTSTFRSGQVGAWKKYFKPHHARLFNEHWGQYQLALGYLLITEEEIMALEQNCQSGND